MFLPEVSNEHTLSDGGLTHWLGRVAEGSADYHLEVCVVGDAGRLVVVEVGELLSGDALVLLARSVGQMSLESVQELSQHLILGLDAAADIWVASRGEGLLDLGQSHQTICVGVQLVEDLVHQLGSS